MNIGENIKKIREQRGVKQQEIADLVGMHRSNYSKIESGQREISVAALDKIADYFGISIDELVHLEEDLPTEVKVEDKTTLEQVKLIQELDPDDKSVIFKMIDTMLTKKKFKDFFQKNIAAL
jgi:transcriptional regulator with XRE-family HTH domain